MTTPIYLDTSVLAHAILGTSTVANEWFASVSAVRPIIASTILRLEITRLLRRESVDIARAEPFLQRIALLSISDHTLRLAGTFIDHIKTLDSIHLAALLLADPNATLVTHDMMFSRVARNLGLSVEDPLAEL